MGLLDNKVILITGAGNGIGRAHALACAAAGARVIVNDPEGGDTEEPAAGRVVAEIIAAGGEAAANTDSVTDPAGCARMVALAQQRWGHLDAVVNNAGILRDVTFKKMTDAQWRAVLDVHLEGTRNVTVAALPLLLDGGGALINTSSYSGLIGNFGQSNYAAAKAGIYGFSRVLALELRKKGVTVNCLAPVAKTRMTADLPMVDAEWRPEQVSPVVVFLASELGRGVTGRVWGIQGQRLHAYEMQMNDGVEKPGDEPWTAEEIAAHVGEIFSFDTSAAAPLAEGDPVTQVFAHFPAGHKPGVLPGWRATMHWVVKGATDQTVNIEGDVCAVQAGLHGDPTCTITIGADTLQAIFSGELDAQKAFMTGKASADDFGDLLKMAQAFDFGAIARAVRGDAAPAENAETVDDTPEGPREWPVGKTYSCGYAFVEPDHITAYAAATGDESVAYYGPDAIAPPMLHVRLLKPVMFALATDPELELDMLRLVHGEHEARFIKPLKPWDLVQLRGELLAVEEKSSGLLVVGGMYAIVEGEVCVECRTSFFVRGMGRKAAEARARAKSGAPRPPRKAPPTPPPADAKIDWAIDADQSYRYALASLDDNPIHTDPETARAAGLPDVILHGLCTMAMAGSTLVNVMGGAQPRALRRLGVRFSKPVHNGDTLTTHIWNDPATDGKATFAVTRGDTPVITGGVVEIGW